MRSFAIFAHNEADLIAQTITSMNAAGFEEKDVAYILINGCTDNTFGIVEEIAKSDDRIRPIKIDFGDKSNAWDVYVDQLAPYDADMHIFMDGDVFPSERAFNEMQQALEKHPEALAVSTLPKGGRQSESWTKRILENHGLPGNLYGIRKEVFQRLRDIPIRIPVGLVGDDPLLRFLLLRDLDPTKDEKLEYVRPVKTAFFEYESLPLNTLWGLKAMWKRQIHYARRELECKLLEELLSRKGIDAMPQCADELWADFPRSFKMQENMPRRFVFFLIAIIKVKLNPKFTRKGKAWYQ